MYSNQNKYIFNIICVLTLSILFYFNLEEFFNINMKIYTIIQGCCLVILILYYRYPKITVLTYIQSILITFIVFEFGIIYVITSISVIYLTFNIIKAIRFFTNCNR